ncbi:hypothetical protein Tco_0823538 [Tanacetum coccineum]|uniref:Uncharacterized protein n=1 Tax=Tanacetum coccineum TaxID=301880 RepID=A0ABQ5AMT4_9ASTR
MGGGRVDGELFRSLGLEWLWWGGRESLEMTRAYTPRRRRVIDIGGACKRMLVGVQSLVSGWVGWRGEFRGAFWFIYGGVYRSHVKFHMVLMDDIGVGWGNGRRKGGRPQWLSLRRIHGGEGVGVREEGDLVWGELGWDSWDRGVVAQSMGRDCRFW